MAAKSREKFEKDLYQFYDANKNISTWVNPINPTNLIKKVNPNQCHCGGELLEMDECKICDVCAARHPIFQSHHNPEDEFESDTSYKPVIYFKEILKHYQGKQTIRNAALILEKIKEQLQKERVEDLTKTTYEELKFVLKKLKLQKHYEHIYFFLNQLGVEIPLFTIQEEEKLIFMFHEVAATYGQFAPINRKSFLNYHYILRALCLQNGWGDRVKDMPVLVDNEKKKEHNKIFSQICKKLGWTFFPLA